MQASLHVTGPLLSSPALCSVAQLEDTADHFSTTLKAGGIMDVVEKVLPV